MRTPHRILAAGYAAAAVLFSVSLTAFAAEDAAKAQALLDQGKAKQALSVLDEHLEKHPHDAEARFLRGLALIGTGRESDAVRVFSDLTRDYPQLPEPYNNLAVLYAKQGEYDKARSALEAALATNPSYATAHENLGDIYAALAQAAYARALQLDGGNPAVRSKLQLIEGLGNKVAIAATDSTPAVPPATAPATAAASAPAPEPAAEPTPAPVSPAASPATGPTASEAADVAPEPVAEADAVPAGDTVVVAPAVDREQILQAVNDWARVWSLQDVDAYLAAYADDFTPEGGLSRSAWAAQRAERINRASDIGVDLEDLRVTRVDATTATVTFKQLYSSESYHDSVLKALDLRLTDGGWKIVREYTR